MQFYPRKVSSQLCRSLYVLRQSKMIRMNQLWWWVGCKQRLICPPKSLGERRLLLHLKSSQETRAVCQSFVTTTKCWCKILFSSHNLFATNTDIKLDKAKPCRSIRVEILSTQSSPILGLTQAKSVMQEKTIQGLISDRWVHKLRVLEKEIIRMVNCILPLDFRLSKIMLTMWIWCFVFRSFTILIEQ